MGHTGGPEGTRRSPIRIHGQHEGRRFYEATATDQTRRVRQATGIGYTTYGLVRRTCEDHGHLRGRGRNLIFRAEDCDRKDTCRPLFEGPLPAGNALETRREDYGLCGLPVS